MTGTESLTNGSKDVKYIRHQQLVDLRDFHKAWLARDGEPYTTVEELWVRYVHWVLTESSAPPLAFQSFDQHRLVREMTLRQLDAQISPQDDAWQAQAKVILEAWPRLMAGECSLRFTLKVEIV